MENDEKPKFNYIQSKLDRLNFNLKYIIFDYLTVYDQLSSSMFLNKQMMKLFKQKELVKFISDERKILFQSPSQFEENFTQENFIKGMATAKEVYDSLQFVFTKRVLNSKEFDFDNKTSFPNFKIDLFFECIRRKIDILTVKIDLKLLETEFNLLEKIIYCLKRFPNLRKLDFSNFFKKKDYCNNYYNDDYSKINERLYETLFQALSSVLKHNKSLKILNLSNNNISTSPKNMQLLGEIIKSNTSIETLILSNIRESEDQKTLNFKFLTESLATNTSIKELNLKGSYLGKNPEDIKALCEIIKQNQTLTKLNLQDIKLRTTQRNVELFAEALMINGSLKNIKLGNNYCRNWECLLKALKNHKSIEKLSLKENSFLDEKKGTPNIIGLLSDIIREATTLKIINLKNNGMSDGFLLAPFIESIGLNKSITTLKLENLNLGRSALKNKSFFETLKMNDNLKVLDLGCKNGHYIGSDFFYALCYYIKETNTLEELNLHNLILGGYLQGIKIKKLCEALKINKSIIKLDLGGNNGIGLSSDILIYFSDFLKTNKTIKKLNLLSALYSKDPERQKIFFNALSKNETIEELNLVENNFFTKEEHMISFLNMMGINTGLKVIYIDFIDNQDNELRKYEFSKLLRSALENNKTVEKIYLNLSISDSIFNFSNNLINRRIYLNRYNEDTQQYL